MYINNNSFFFGILRYYTTNMNQYHLFVTERSMMSSQALAASENLNCLLS